MFTEPEMDRLLDAMRANGVTWLEIAGDDALLRLSLPPSTAAHSAPPAPPALIAATSPEIGSFLPRGSDDGLAALALGQDVQAGEVIGYVTRGDIRAAVTAPVAGRIAGDLPATGTLIGYGDTIAELEADA